MNTVLQRIFGAATRQSKPGKGAPLSEIQFVLSRALDDCHSVSTDRLLYRIDHSKTPAELWALRSDLHQCVAQGHSESVAAERINGLSKVFEGWVPQARLEKIHPDFTPSQK